MVPTEEERAFCQTIPNIFCFGLSGEPDACEIKVIKWIKNENKNIALERYRLRFFSSIHTQRVFVFVFVFVFVLHNVYHIS